MALEMIADPGCCDRYQFELSADGRCMQSEPVLMELVRDTQANVPAPVMAAKFHRAIADVIARVAGRLRDESGVRRVALSGGVFQNRLLLEWTWQQLEANGFEVYAHHRVPTNDGGLALGQAVVAAARVQAGRI